MSDLFPGSGRTRQLGLAAVMVLQSVAVVFFVGDAGFDLITAPAAGHSVVETLVAVALVAGIVLSARELRLTLEHVRAQDRALETARGELARVIDEQFAEWGLTPAERDVGLLVLKGLDAAEIAGLRSAAQGTVRAQLARIYAKAGVSGRAQFAAWFVEDLLDGGVAGPERATG